MTYMSKSANGAKGGSQLSQLDTSDLKSIIIWNSSLLQPIPSFGHSTCYGDCLNGPTLPSP